MEVVLEVCYFLFVLLVLHKLFQLIQLIQLQLELEVEIMQTEVILFLQELQLSHQLVVVEGVQILLLVDQEVQVVEVVELIHILPQVEDQELLVKEMLEVQTVLLDHLDSLVEEVVVNLELEQLEQMLELVDLEELV